MHVCTRYSIRSAYVKIPFLRIIIRQKWFKELLMNEKYIYVQFACIKVAFCGITFRYIRYVLTFTAKIYLFICSKNIKKLVDVLYNIANVSLISTCMIYWKFLKINFFIKEDLILSDWYDKRSMIYKSIKLELRSFSLKLYDYLDSNIGMYLIESFMLIKSFLFSFCDRSDHAIDKW